MSTLGVLEAANKPLAPGTMDTVSHSSADRPARRRLGSLACVAAVLLAGTGVPTAQAQVPVVEPVTAAQLGATWRPDCPVAPGQLRRVELDYLGLDAQPHRGQLVVHQDIVGEVIAAFDRLYRLGFPIERMQTVDRYPNADDELSMRDNNTSAFNCRGIPGSSQWSFHAYGRAIDVNPRFNPYIDRTGAFEPANAGVYLDRDRIDPGLLHADDAAVRAFTEHGWRWGGYWRTPKDYQHFEWG